jgi:hypothetical protein
MFTKKLAFILILLLGFMSGFVKAQSQSEQRDRIQLDESSHKQQYEIGSNIGQALATGCSIFIGTVSAIGQPIKEFENIEDDRSAFYTPLTLNIDESLWGEPNSQSKVLQIYKVSKPKLSLQSGPWRLWENVELRIGKKLLVVLWADNIKKQREHLGKASEQAGIVSEEQFFPVIREILRHHDRYLQNPDQIEQFGKLLNTEYDFIFSGYLISYLSVKVSYTDKEVSTLIKLLGSNHTTQTGWFFTAKTLTRSIVSEYSTLSPTMRNNAIEALVIAASSNNSNLAKQGISFLIFLTDVNKELNIQSFLNTDRKNKITGNYNKFFSEESRQSVRFRNQLGLPNN